MLTGVFDPPPTALSVPWAHLAGVAGATLAALVLATSAAVHRAQRSPIVVLREL